jgi:hypothetical protein
MLICFFFLYIKKQVIFFEICESQIVTRLIFCQLLRLFLKVTGEETCELFEGIIESLTRPESHIHP